MRQILAFLLAIFLVVAPVNSYPQTEFDDCVISTKDNPEMADLEEESIEGFCDCALTNIFDENKVDNLWMNVCINTNLYP